MTATPPPEVLESTAGDLPLEAVVLEIGDRAWSIQHSGAVLTSDQEQAFLKSDDAKTRPYGIVLWPAAIALAHDLATRDLTGIRILELGAGTGLPGLVAAARGAHVVQTDRSRLVLHLCERNAARNGIATIERRVADWTEWSDPARYDLVIGSDVLYSAALHAPLRQIFERNLAPGGTLLLSDPFRAASLELLEAMAGAGWAVTLDKWTVGIAPPLRPVGVFTLVRS